MKILAIDPGNVESAYIIWDGKNIQDFNKVENEYLLNYILPTIKIDKIVIEKIASYGMPVGKDVFETVFWTGRFFQIHSNKTDRVLRKDVKMHICHSNKASDANIITALVDRFGNRHKHGKYSKGKKKNPGFFYGFYKDIWQAFALAVYYYDNLKIN